ncbi:MAG: hypothetical protein EZS28_047393, partial [Streblomastix strix]
MGQW